MGRASGTNYMRRSTIQLLLFASILALATACTLLNSPRYGNELELELDSQARVTCSEECSARGQCGTSLDESIYVLGSIDGPRVDNHNRAFVNDSAVTIKSRVPQNLQRLEDGQQFSMNFYEVTTTDLTKAGWVAGWCIASP